MPHGIRSSGKNVSVPSMPSRRLRIRPAPEARLQTAHLTGSIYARSDQVYYCMEVHFVRRMSRMRLRCCLLATVMLATTLGHAQSGHPETVHSLRGGGGGLKEDLGSLALIVHSLRGGGGPVSP